MKHISTLVLMAAGVIASAQSPFHFSSALGKFSVDLPAKPVHRTDAMNLQGSNVMTYLDDARAGKNRVIVVFAKLPPKISGDNIKGVPEAYVDTEFHRMHATVSEKMFQKVNGVDGDDITFRMGKILGETFIYANGNRMIGVFITSPTKAGLSALRHQVFGSIHISR